MIFSKNISSTVLLETELIRLKVLYAKALELKNETTIKDLRKTIKILTARRNIVSADSIRLA